MIEKVWAKVNGNYENIDGGSVTEGYDFMLGAPSVEYNMNSSPINYNTTNTSSPYFQASLNQLWNIVNPNS